MEEKKVKHNRRRRVDTVQCTASTRVNPPRQCPCLHAYDCRLSPKKSLKLQKTTPAHHSPLYPQPNRNQPASTQQISPVKKLESQARIEATGYGFLVKQRPHKNTNPQHKSCSPSPSLSLSHARLTAPFPLHLYDASAPHLTQHRVRHRPVWYTRSQGGNEG